jgi:MYXO-CTERM domain-containing protein
MRKRENDMQSTKRLLTLLLAALALVSIGLAPRAAGAAPIKIACVGDATHSHAFPPLNRETQPIGMQEYPAMLQRKLGANYGVRNFCDCCASALQGYSTVGQETHPYVQGSNAGDGPGYNESIAFLPDIVIIGSWGRHDWGKGIASTETWNITKFQQGYDDLVQRYMKLSTHPRIFASLPIPILYGTDTDNGVLTSDVAKVVKAVAAKYGLPIIDLYTPFFGHMELYKQPPDPRGEGEHVTDVGLGIIADQAYAALMADADAGRPEGGPGPSDGSSDARVDASVDAGLGGAGGAGGAVGTASTSGATTTGASGSGESATSGSGGVAGSSSGSGTTSSGTSSSTTGGEAGSSTSTPAGSEPAGCSCRIAQSSGDRGHAAWNLAALGATAILSLRRRRRS